MKNQVSDTRLRTKKNKDGSIRTSIQKQSLFQLCNMEPVNHRGRKMRMVWKTDFKDMFVLPILSEEPEAGVYNVFFETNHGGTTYAEIIGERYRPQGWIPTQGSVLAQTVQNYFEKTGKVLLYNWWSRSVDGSWSEKTLAGNKEVYHVRLRCVSDDEQGHEGDIKLEVDIHFSDDSIDEQTGLTLMQLVNKV